MKKLIEIINEIKDLEWSGGYDRNGSHDAGEYRDYTGKVGDVVHDTYLYPIAEYLQQALKAQYEAGYRAGIEGATQHSS